MKRVVERERNKRYYRALHLPIWIWVFWILPGHLTGDLYAHGPDRRHGIWLVAVTAVCLWRGWLGRLPGVEAQPYITHWGVEQKNLPYRVVCYSAAWIDLLVPFALNLVADIVAVARGRWILHDLYNSLYYLLAAPVILAAALGWIPRARRSTVHEGRDRGWFYIAVWTVVPTQLAAWAMWRLGSRLHMNAIALNRTRLLTFLTVATFFLLLGLAAKLPRTARWRGLAPEPAPAGI